MAEIDQANPNQVPTEISSKEKTKRNFLENWGLRYFKKLSELHPPISSWDAVHTLTPEEQKGLIKVERKAVFWAAFAGAVSAFVCAIVEINALPLYEMPNDEGKFRFWIIVGIVTIVASILEILFLYWYTLRSVHQLSVVAGIELFPKNTDEEAEAVAGALARAAMEVPNPTESDVNVDPYREKPKWQLAGFSFAYKIKVSASNFLIKFLIRRALGRAAVKSWLPMVAVPVTTIWNAWVCKRVIHEARIRVMGPSAANEYAEQILQSTSLSPEGKRAALAAVSGAIVRTSDLHPNLIAFLMAIAKTIEFAPEPDLGDTKKFLGQIETLSKEEQKIVLRILTIALVIDGRITRAERRLWINAHNLCGFDPNIEDLKLILAYFDQGICLNDKIKKVPTLKVS